MWIESLIKECLIAMPLLSWVLLGLAVLITQILTANAKISCFLSLGGLAVLLMQSIVSFEPQLSASLFAGTLSWDAAAQFFNILCLIICLAVGLMLMPGFRSKEKIIEEAYTQLPEVLMCLILSGFGASVLASSMDLTTMFLGLEILSIGVYCLCGFYRTELRSTEAAFKYLLIGAFSTVVFLYGLAFLYGATGATQFKAIGDVLTGERSPLVVIGVLFALAGMAFKMAFVPFHLYTADVYEGAPTPITAFMATIIKVGVVGVLMRFLWVALGPVYDLWQGLWLALCVLSILIGNLGALQQSTIKRLLAFSSISHAGFLGLGVLTGASNTFPLLAYVTVYSAMSLGSFAVIHWLENRQRPFFIEDLRGLAHQKLGAAVLFSIFMLGLAGIPPFAGFMIKFWILQSLITKGFWGVALIAILGSLIGAVYYLRILVFMFVSKEKGAASQWVGSGDRFFALRLVIYAAALLTLLGSLRPQIYADWILSTLALK